jgi:hypothetical protein
MKLRSNFESIIDFEKDENDKNIHLEQEVNKYI